MKKKIVAMILLVAMVAGLTACGGGQGEESSESASGSTVEKTETVSSGPEEDVIQDTLERNDYYLWITTLEKGEQKMPTMLFDERLSVPLTEESMNALGTFTTYNFFEMGEAEGYTGLRDFTEVTTILDSPIRTIGSNPLNWADIEIQEQNKENGFEKLCVINPNEDNQMTIREAFDQGYWYIQADTAPASAFGFEDKELWNEETKQWDRYNCIIETLGSPSYIMTEKKSDIDGNDISYSSISDYDKVIGEAFAKEAIEKQGLVMVHESYWMIYEYEEFVIAVGMSEMFGADASHSTINSGIFDIRYYPMNGWDNYFKNEMMEKRIILELTDV